MKILKGISAASGIAEGMVCIYNNKIENKIPHYVIAPSQVANEHRRLQEAFERARTEMSNMIQVAKDRFDEKAAGVFDTHLLILQDTSLYKKIADLIQEKLINAEHAVTDIFEQYIKQYQAQEGHFQELTHDLIDARTRIISGFTMESGHFQCPIGERKAVIVAAKRLTPSMVLNIPREHVLAFIAKEGGFTSHATILARSYGVPIVFGIEVEAELDCSTEVIVNGSQGKVIIAPDEKTKAYYKKKIEHFQNKKLVCATKTDVHHARTRKAQKLNLKLNISTPEEVVLIEGLLHEGVGLLRSEFLFIHDDKPPQEEEQYRVYKKILEAVPEPVTVRILDLSNDKMPSYLEFPEGLDPEKGIRGALALELFKDLYLAQFKALLRANTKGNLRLLYPMVADLNDLYTFRRVLLEAKMLLKKEKTPFFDAHVPEGVMIETPAAVMLSREIFQEIDFVNVGSNDLLQYTLAAARGNYLTEKRYHILHPALVRLLEIVVREGKRAKKEVCLCGEVASFEEFYPLLLEIGIQSFSVSVSKFVDIQCELSHLKKSRRGTHLHNFYKIKNKEEADEYFSKFL